MKAISTWPDLSTYRFLKFPVVDKLLERYNLEEVLNQHVATDCCCWDEYACSLVAGAVESSHSTLLVLRNLLIPL